ncbi:DEAD/DEAH box helicase [Barnesiella sp. WM24]|uniref:DEAD/DEAH box helicase n=1 Tax=Barnesiella sp. WM24 TaxID=2558278 RepID=UPI00107267D6|nr:DEAD/DEAH box helicase [Barnesiella sp. WM24]TFU92757.1 DEAD/DEAH box helicase [Barnesiella sp. WM24]
MKQSVILENISSRLGIAELNPMQRELMSSQAHDVVLLSPTGSGKTVAFTISMLQALGKPKGEVQAVVIAPSRELVMQIYRVVREVATGYKTVALYGGHSMTDEKNSLTPVPDIVIATPGRLLDHLNRKLLDLYNTKVLVLDEYDKSLELGFHDEMRKILRLMPNLSRTVLTSATPLSDRLPEFMKVKNPVVMDFLSSVAKPRTRMSVVRVESPAKDKVDTLVDLLKSLPNGRVIVFVNHRESATRLYDHLKKAGLPVGIYHGALDQNDREKAVDLLNNGTTPVLVSTDLGARGLDIEEVKSIIHYHMPLTKETWTHRNGRTARVDATGTIYVITSESDNIPDYVTFDRSYVPTGTSADPIHADCATLYFSAGRKERISRGDIAGFLMKTGGLAADEVGRIIVRDHSAIVAVPAGKADSVLRTVATEKIKGKRVKISKL